MLALSGHKTWYGQTAVYTLLLHSVIGLVQTEKKPCTQPKSAQEISGVQMAPLLLQQAKQTPPFPSTSSSPCNARWRQEKPVCLEHTCTGDAGCTDRSTAASAMLSFKSASRPRRRWRLLGSRRSIWGWLGSMHLRGPLYGIIVQHKVVLPHLRNHQSNSTHYARHAACTSPEHAIPMANDTEVDTWLGL